MRHHALRITLLIVFVVLASLLLSANGQAGDVPLPEFGPWTCADARTFDAYAHGTATI